MTQEQQVLDEQMTAARTKQHEEKRTWIRTEEKEKLMKQGKKTRKSYSGRRW